MDNTQTTQIKRRQPMHSKALHAINRRFALYRAGMTQRDIAASLHISPVAVSQAINGVRTSLPVVTKLAEVTGMSINELFPDGRYSHIEQEAA